MIQILQGDCREVLKTLPDCSVHCCVTSPPYFGLRDYNCVGQIGLESTPDAYVAELVAVFSEVKRVLRDDGTLWLNLGDSYATHASGGKGYAHNFHPPEVAVKNGIDQPKPTAASIGLKEKDLVGIPWRVAFALQADGWWLRQDIIWAKPNPMPESVKDRCTKAHEYIFLLAKSPRYYYDAEAIKEDVAESQVGRVRDDVIGGNKGDDVHHSPGGRYSKGRGGRNAFRGQGHFRYGENGPANRAGRNMKDIAAGEDKRNRRSVWTVTTKPYREAHFATFPPDLIQPCIRAGCPAGGTVLDPFGGSGTTGEVAASEGRKAILIELNPQYVKLAQGRGGLFCASNPRCAE